MVGTIAPLVQVARKQWSASIGAYFLASTAAGSILGTLLGTLGAAFVGDLSLAPILGVLIGLAIVFALIDLGFIRLRLPTTYRSVPQSWWVRLGPIKASLAYGAVLGTGVSTVVPIAGFYLLPVSFVLLGPLSGSIIGAGYGFGRALPVVAASLMIARGTHPLAIGRWVMAPSQRRLARVACACSLIAVASSLFPAMWLG